MAEIGRRERVAVVEGVGREHRLEGQTLHGRDLDECRAVELEPVGAVLRILVGYQRVEGAFAEEVVQPLDGLAVFVVGGLVGGDELHGEDRHRRDGAVARVVFPVGIGGLRLLEAQTEVHAQLEPLRGAGLDVRAEGVAREVRTGGVALLLEVVAREVVARLLRTARHAQIDLVGRGVLLHQDVLPVDVIRLVDAEGVDEGVADLLELVGIGVVAVAAVHLVGDVGRRRGVEQLVGVHRTHARLDDVR